MEEKITTPGGDTHISRDQLRDALQALGLPSVQLGCIKFPFSYTFDMADAIMRHVRAEAEHDEETLTWGEIRAAYHRLGRPNPEVLLEDVVAHRAAYNPGTIVKDADGQLYRRSGPGSWRVLGDNEPVDNTVPVRPLEVIYEPE